MKVVGWLLTVLVYAGGAFAAVLLCVSLALGLWSAAVGCVVALAAFTVFAASVAGQLDASRRGQAGPITAPARNR